jgi:hypothetical protein
MLAQGHPRHPRRRRDPTDIPEANRKSKRRRTLKYPPSLRPSKSFLPSSHHLSRLAFSLACLLICSPPHHLKQMPPERALVSRYPSEDPLTTAIQPPPNESPEERREREKNEAAAKLRSDIIDDFLRISGKKSKATKLLLLGSST